MKKILYILIILFIFSTIFFFIGRIKLIKKEFEYKKLCAENFGMYKISDVPAICYESFIGK